MSECTIYSPPKRKLHNLDYTQQRVLLTSTTDSSWKQQILADLKDHDDIIVFDAADDFFWAFEHSFIATIIPLYLNTPQDAGLLTLLGKHASSGKIIVCCGPSFPHVKYVNAICEFDGVSYVYTLEELIDRTLISLGKTPKYRKLLEAID